MNNELRKDLELLSAYLDGELSASEKAELENKIMHSPELRNELEKLKKLKNLTGSIKRIPESSFFETRLMAEIEKPKSAFTKMKAWVPAAALVLVTIAVMVLMKINPGFFDDIWEDQKTAIAGFYKENLHPLLFTADLNNEDIFDFAFNNRLPLDDNRKQFLQIGYDDSGKEYFEIKPAELIDNKDKSGYKEFISALKLDSNQKELVDSIIGRYAEVLESQVLVNENNTVAINPNLWNYRKALFADLLVLAENLNKKEFTKFIPGGLSDSERIRVVNAVNKMKNVNENEEKSYIFLTPDSIFSDNYIFQPVKYKKKIDNIKEQLEETNKKIKQINYVFNYDSTINKLNKKTAAHNRFRIFIDSNICRVALEGFDIHEIQIPDFDSIESIINEATSNFQMYSYKVPKIEHSSKGFKFKYYDGDSLQSYEFNIEELNLDSLLQAENNSGKQSNWKSLMRINDSIASQYGIHYNKNYKPFDAGEMKVQMEQLQKELQKFREEMYNWQKEMQRQQTTGYEKKR